jgi:hypothetical protein
MELTTLSAPPTSRAARSPACLADRRADDIGALRRTHDGVGDLGIGDQHVLDVTRQIDHDGFADAEREVSRIHLSIGGGNRRHGAIVARHHRGEGRVERQRRNRRKRQGADRIGPHRRLISPASHILRPLGHFSIVVWVETP